MRIYSILWRFLHFFVSTPTTIWSRFQKDVFWFLSTSQKRFSPHVDFGIILYCIFWAGFCSTLRCIFNSIYNEYFWILPHRHTEKLKLLEGLLDISQSPWKQRKDDASSWFPDCKMHFLRNHSHHNRKKKCFWSLSIFSRHLSLGTS